MTKTLELIGPALDWAVATCEWLSVTRTPQSPNGYLQTSWDKETKWENAGDDYHPSTNWDQGGPIIEREGISWHCGNKSSWHAYGYGSADNITGPTPLIAAMRCFVASRLGDDVTIPEELIK